MDGAGYEVHQGGASQESCSRRLVGRITAPQMVRHNTLAPLALLSAGILLAGCAGGDADSPDDVAETTTLTFANSFTMTTPITAVVPS